MNINIADNIRRLRMNKGITQETLADFLGVSAQAVSKWERGDGLPDIAMLPPLATFFDVTLDELMNMNEFRNNEELAEMKNKYREFCSLERYEEAVAIMKEILRRFPNDYETMAHLAEYSLDFEEALSLCRRILEFCPKNDLRSYAAYQETCLLHSLGRKEEALEKAKMLPPLEYSRELNIAWLLAGEERVKECQTTIDLLGWAFYGEIEQLADSGVYDEEKCIALYQKAIDCYQLIFDDGNMGYNHLRVSNCYFQMGLYALDLNQQDRAGQYFKKSAEHAKILDSLPNEKTLTSLLTDRCVFEKIKTTGVGTYAQYCRERLAQKEKLKIGRKYTGSFEKFMVMFE